MFLKVAVIHPSVEIRIFPIKGEVVLQLLFQARNSFSALTTGELGIHFDEIRAFF